MKTKMVSIAVKVLITSMPILSFWSVVKDVLRAIGNAHPIF